MELSSSAAASIDFGVLRITGPAEISHVRRSQPSCSHPHLRLTTMRAALRIPAGPGHAKSEDFVDWPNISLLGLGSKPRCKRAGRARTCILPDLIRTDRAG